MSTEPPPTTTIGLAPRKGRIDLKANWNPELMQIARGLDDKIDSLKLTMHSPLRGQFEELINKIRGWAASPDLNGRIIDGLDVEARQLLDKVDALLREASEQLPPSIRQVVIPPPQTSLADLIKSVAQDSVKLTAQGKRRLTRARNDMGLPDLASAVEICAALHEALVDYIDTDGAISIIHPTTRLQTRIQLR